MGFTNCCHPSVTFLYFLHTSNVRSLPRKPAPTRLTIWESGGRHHLLLLHLPWIDGQRPGRGQRCSLVAGQHGRRPSLRSRVERADVEPPHCYDGSDLPTDLWLSTFTMETSGTVISPVLCALKLCHWDTVRHSRMLCWSQKTIFGKTFRRSASSSVGQLQRKQVRQLLI